ncbi:hypothetical protein LJ737_07460 [Hymenobacter sp. 15J16-1T3B]|uniref:hypothetical protein n=1 Tax=Hymenobacter sp. 15J16-1T3B TaxID=2886941 RepID=UPI001D10337D|nr:hypothetical protein [Hymenobacter sp. 15J16-1T3B]MCC3157070.1 hypothetical protein [Hymenobacter sp. 15J16-1T3B]
MHELIDRIATTLRAKCPHVRISVRSDDELAIHPANAQGFAIVVQAGEREHTLYFGNWHFHFDNTADGKNELLDYLSYGLSTQGRLKTYARAGREYKWTFEMQNPDNQSWQPVGTMGTFDWRFWLTPQIRYAQNDLLEW